MKTIILYLIFFPIFFFSQSRVDTIDCERFSLLDLENEFYHEPSCEKYKILKAAYTCNRKAMENIKISYVAALKVNCKQAYQDLYSFYKRLNYELSEKSMYDRNTLLMENLDENTVKFAIKSLILSEINKTDLAAYYYYGIYMNKNYRKAVSLFKEAYNYDISDEEIIDELNDMKSLFIPCK